MDLRKTKRKRPEKEENSEDMYIRFSFPKERSIIDEDSFYSCNSSDDSNCNQENGIQPRSFLEGTEPRDYIKIELDSTNPDIMPQEVVVYGYENASFVQKFRRANKTVQPQNLNSNMSKLTISPQRIIPPSISTASSNIKCESIEDVGFPESSNNNIGQSGDNLVNSCQSEFTDLSSFRMTQLLPCTQTTGHKIDDISRYILTPNLEPGYISNLQFNIRPNTRNVGTIISILKEEESQFTYETPKSPTASASVSSPPLNFDDEVSSSSEPHSVRDPLRKYLCRKCDIEFRLHSPFLTHLRTHINIDTLICEMCNKQLSNMSEIQKHVSKHAKVKTFFCEYCSMVFPDVRHKETHIIRSIQGVAYDCPACPGTFCSKVGHGTHIRTHRKIIRNMSKRESNSTRRKWLKNYRLEESEVLKKSNTQIVNHPQIVISVSQSDAEKVEPIRKSPSNDTANQDTFPCPFCSRNYKTEQHLAQHVVFHKTRKEYTCGHCTRVFYNSDIFKTHMLKCKSIFNEEKKENSGNIGPKVFSCEDCKTVFKNRRSLSLHTCKHTTHGSVSKMKSRTKRNFGSSSLLTEHISLETCRNPDFVEPETEPFACPDCDKIYKNKNTLRQHYCHPKALPIVKSQQDADLDISTQNHEAKPLIEEHKCTCCASIFLTKEKLIDHKQNDCLSGTPVEYAVTRKVFYYCPKCTGKFPTRELLDIHFRDLCSGRPSSKYKPRSKRTPQDSRRKILVDKPSKFVCDICGENLQYLSSLQKHVMHRTCITNPLQKNNSLDKYKAQLIEYLPYTCKLCNISLTSMTALIKHNKRDNCKISDSSSLDFVVEREIYIDGVHDQCAESSPTTTNNTNESTESTESKTETVEEKKEISNNYICVYCNERFSDLRLFKSHIAAGLCMIRSNLFDGWKVCSGCKKLFSCVTNIRRHLKTSCKFFKNQTPE